MYVLSISFAVFFFLSSLPSANLKNARRKAYARIEAMMKTY